MLYGGTDPGRFCPTYMIYCESFIPPSCQPEQDQKFNRRDVYLITQNALADPTYLDYIRAQYNRSLQIDPPFFQNVAADRVPAGLPQSRPARWRGWTTFSRTLGPRIERRRRTGTSWFKESDFPTPENSPPNCACAARAMNSRPSRAARPWIQPPGPTGKLSKFLYGKLSAETKALLDARADNQTLAPRPGGGFQPPTTGDGPTIYDAGTVPEHQTAAADPEGGKG